MNHILTIILFALRFAAAISLVVFALYWRSPILASIRAPALAAFIVTAVAFIAFEIWWLLRKRNPRLIAISSFAVLLTACGGLALTLFHEAQFHWQRHQVLRADAASIERLGRHLVVGYRDLRELRDLVERRAIAGVFVTAHNVQGKDAGTIRSEIASLQDIRKTQGLPPLLISTDQEGGLVSRMSPPLPRQQSPGDIVRQYKDETERRRAIQTFATDQGRALAALGFNLNFAPVVDINHNIVNEDDHYTRIFQRAISDDPHVVTAVAGDYCTALMQTGVHCTLKHFPGLGRVVEDTHLNDADLTAPIETLAASDWVPFRALMHHAGAVTMLGHARLTALDKTTPASFSKAVVSDLLRGEWNHDGVLITDDFNMSPAYASPGGIGGAAVTALNAGVDLILISYDGDQFYPTMHALLRADAAGLLRREQLARSDRRLGRMMSMSSATAKGGR